jgi:predicted  nucleic acid-binding Zn-ribbon protein
MTAMDNLISLAMVDEEIKEIESSRGDLPSRIEKLEADKTNFENKIEGFNEKLKSLNDRQVELNRNKEDSDVVKENLFKISTELKDIADSKNAIDEDVKLNQSQIDECTQKLDKYSSQLKNLMNENEKEYQNLNLQKEKLIGTIDDSILSQYNIMLNAKGFGAAAVIGDACGACYATLPTQLITEVKQKNEYKYCPSCAILLYFEE